VLVEAYQNVGYSRNCALLFETVTPDERRSKNDQLWRDLRHGRSGLRETGIKASDGRCLLSGLTSDIRKYLHICSECNRKRSHLVMWKQF